MCCFVSQPQHRAIFHKSSKYLTADRNSGCLKFLILAFGSPSAITPSAVYLSTWELTNWLQVICFSSFRGPSFSVALTKCASAAYAWSFMNCWNSHMIALSCIPLESHAVLKLSKDDRISIISDSLDTEDFVCRSMRLALFAIGSEAYGCIKVRQINDPWTLS